MSKRYESITAFVLAGGKSSRMGEEKAFKTINGKSLMDYAISQAHSVADDVFVVGDKILFGAYGRIVSDIHPGCGPLGGIHAALDRARTEFSVILALDTPFLTRNLLTYINEQAQEAEKLVTVPRAQNGYHPLCAVYRKGFQKVAEQAILMKQLKIDSLFTPENTRTITAEELLEHKFNLNVFDNINTPEDFERASKLRPDLHG